MDKEKEREKAKRISRIYYANIEYIKKYNNVDQRMRDVNYRIKENKEFEELYPFINNYEVFKKINK